MREKSSEARSDLARIGQKYVRLLYRRAAQLVEYDPVRGFFRWKADRGSVHAGETAGGVHGNGRYYVTVEGERIEGGKLAWLLTWGRLPQRVSYVNGDLLDHRLCNLVEGRQGTLREPRELAGVYRNRNQWAARLPVAGARCGWSHSEPGARQRFRKQVEEFCGEPVAMN